jgi:hypothetical protein
MLFDRMIDTSIDGGCAHLPDLPIPFYAFHFFIHSWRVHRAIRTVHQQHTPRMTHDA